VGTVSTSVKKLISKMKTGSVLSAISGSVNQSDIHRFSQALSDTSIQASYVKNAHATNSAVQKILAFTSVGTAKIASTIDTLMKPSVVQVSKNADGYTVKTAFHGAWAPKSSDHSRGDVVKIFGSKVVLAADLSGSVTMTEGPDMAAEEAPESKAVTVTDFGMYKVRTLDGEELVGFVFPNLVDVDGVKLPVSLFTNGSVTAFQSDIAGEPAGDGKNPPTGNPESGGYGSFFRTLPDGEIEVTYPMNMLSCFREQGGSTRHFVELIDGHRVFVSQQPSLKDFTCSDDHYMLPGDWQWMPLGHNKSVALIEHPDNFDKTGSDNSQFVYLRHSAADCFSLSGAPIEKLAYEETNFIGPDQLMFVLGGLGVDLNYSHTKIAETIATNSPAAIMVGREIKLASELQQESREKAASYLRSAPKLSRDLFKEAALIPDPMAVDNVLSLAFINAENLSTYIQYLPQLEKTQANLCELLLGVRLGLQSIPASPLEKCVKTLEEVIEGLKVLAFQQS
jgi:hypothetical protein